MRCVRAHKKISSKKEEQNQICTLSMVDSVCWTNLTNGFPLGFAMYPFWGVLEESTKGAFCEDNILPISVDDDDDGGSWEGIADEDDASIIGNRL